MGKDIIVGLLFKVAEFYLMSLVIARRSLKMPNNIRVVTDRIIESLREEAIPK